METPDAVPAAWAPRELLLDHLLEQTGGDAEFARSILADFLVDTDQRLARARAAPPDNRRVVAAEAHTIQGSAGTVGAHRVQAACRELTRAARADREDLAAPLAAVDHALALLRSEIESAGWLPLS